MSRLSNAPFLAAHHWLRQLWLADLSSYAQVSERDQIELHLYFCPSKDWSDDKLLEHRRIISKADPSLPQRAGRSLQRFKRAQAGEVVYAPRVYESPARGRQRGYAITVRGVRTPEPDLHKLARAVIRMTEERDRHEDDSAA